MKRTSVWVIIGTLLLMSMIILIGVVIGLGRNRGGSGIQVVKWANPDPAQPGDDITYDIYIINYTDSDVTGIFTDITEGSTKYDDHYGPVENVNIADGGKNLTGTVTVLAGETIWESVYMTVENDADVGSEITNTVTFTNADYDESSGPTTVRVISKR
jgi:hypothetical protein